MLNPANLLGGQEGGSRRHGKSQSAFVSVALFLWDVLDRRRSLPFNTTAAVNQV